ncbi:MAG: hypothetical protein IPG02_19240 [Ignavibacteria bacterium]|nr:hypothetical protein [Ignavibacteria bacterium]
MQIYDLIILAEDKQELLQDGRDQFFTYSYLFRDLLAVLGSISTSKIHKLFLQYRL